MLFYSPFSPAAGARKRGLFIKSPLLTPSKIFIRRTLRFRRMCPKQRVSLSAAPQVPPPQVAQGRRSPLQKVGATWRDVAYALRERGDIMQLDRKTMEKLLSLSDRQLSAVLDKLGREYGLDLSAFQIRPGDLDGVRRTIRNMSDADLLRLGEQLKNGGKGR